MNIEKELRDIRNTIVAIANYNYANYSEFREKEYTGHLTITLIDNLLEKIDLEKEAMLSRDDILNETIAEDAMAKIDY
jgi:hypothetical protein